MNAQLSPALIEELPRYVSNLNESKNHQTGANNVSPWRIQTVLQKLWLAWNDWKLKDQRRQFVELIKQGNSLFENLRLEERAWRMRIIRGEELYDEAVEQKLMDGYNLWSDQSLDLLERIDSIETEQRAIRGEDSFRAHIDEAEEILFENNPIFREGDFAARWYAAIDFRIPKPRPVRVDSEGRIFEMTGEQITMPGLEPDAVLEALEDERAGRLHSLEDVLSLDPDALQA
jgi:hypothetical protein